MFMVRLTSLVLGFMVSANAWALELREGDIFRGRIHLGKSIGQSCHIRVKAINHSERTYRLLMYKINYLAGRTFEARNYEKNMTAQGSSALTLNKDKHGRYMTELNPKETLHVEIKNQTISSARIYNGEKVIVNCLDMKRVSPN